MAKRNYNQYCPLAKSLDIIGDRWTMLIVRELLWGPRRYSDILKGLPGIGTNLLANRLKELEEAGLIAQHKLPPPAASTVYQLTPRGEGLKPAIFALTDWGVGYLQAPVPDDDFVGVIPMMSALKQFFPVGAYPDVDVCCEVHALGEVFYAQVRQGQVTVSTGNAPAPDVVVEFDDLKTLVNLFQRIISIDDAASGDLMRIVDGSRAAFQQFLDSYRTPTP